MGPMRRVEWSAPPVLVGGEEKRASNYHESGRIHPLQSGERRFLKERSGLVRRSNLNPRLDPQSKAPEVGIATKIKIEKQKLKIIKNYNQELNSSRIERSIVKTFFTLTVSKKKSFYKRFPFLLVSFEYAFYNVTAESAFGQTPSPRHVVRSGRSSNFILRLG